MQTIDTMMDVQNEKKKKKRKNLIEKSDMQKTGMTGENFTACLNNLPNSALKKDVIFCIGQNKQI